MTQPRLQESNAVYQAHPVLIDLDLDAVTSRRERLAAAERARLGAQAGAVRPAVPLAAGSLRWLARLGAIRLGERRGRRPATAS